MSRASSPFLTLVVASALLACGKDSAPPKSPEADGAPPSSGDDAGAKPPSKTDDGVAHENPAGFKVWFPSEPISTASDVETEGGTVRQTQLVATSGDIVMQVVIGDNAKEVLQERSVPYMLANLGKGTASAFPGLQVTKSEPFTLGEHPGQRLELGGSITGAGAVKGDWRFILVGARTFQVVTMWPDKGEMPAASKRFLESFALTDAAPKEKIADLTQKPWALYKDPAGLFQIEAPGEAKTQEQEAPMGDLKAKVRSFVWSEGMYGKYTVTVLQLPQEVVAGYDPKAAIDAFERTWVAKWNGKNAATKPYGDGGLELSFDTEEQGNLLRVRGFTLWKAPYLIQAITRLGDLEDKAKVERFVTSFKLTAP